LAPGHAGFPCVPEIPVQFARLFQSATGIIVLSQLAIATSNGIEKLMTMLKGCRSLLVDCKSQSLFQSSPHYLIFALIVAFCPQAHSASANVAYFAGGCFWCTEAVFQQVPGVTSVVSGYMQGAETIQVTFDPAKTTYNKLLNMFWRAHNPTEVDSQGPDTGKQYRSAIFFVDEQQHAAAEKSKAQAQKSFSQPIATEIARAGSFRPALEKHQNFCRKNPSNPYVRQIVDPKLKKLGMKTP
jgi:peptide-methionine (S)-S-oxide reductase